MPRICEFNGIVIVMYRNEHGPPHFHAVYGEHQAVVGVDPIQVVRGRLPGRIQRIVLEWASLHQAALADNWRRARLREDVVPIDPPR